MSGNATDPPATVVRRGRRERLSGGSVATNTRPPMTVAHHTEALRAPSLTAALIALRMRGMRVSATRRRLLERLFRAAQPLTAEELAGRLDLASVYRNLDALEAVGLVRHVHVGHGPGLYALAGRRETGYAACERCGRHAALEPDALAAVHTAVRRATGFTSDFSHFPIVGLCPDCAADHGEEHHAHP
jgi:Fur family transcriptional regulator, ferric uptake regulator